jgi:hypothetical protein
MEYNSQREFLKISEYGRNIQKMVEYAQTIDDRTKRNKLAKTIIRVMAIMSPQIKDVTDYEQKLWNHLFHIADYQLDVDCPYPIPTREIHDKKPDRIEYPLKKIQYKHYGHTLELMIKAAIELEEGAEKTYLIESIANLMKKFYLSWNRDSVNDQLIYDHLKELSRGKLVVRPDFVLADTQSILARNNIGKPRPVSKHHKHNNGKNNQHKYKRK